MSSEAIPGVAIKADRVNHREIGLLVARAQLDKQIERLVQDFFSAGVSRGPPC